LRERESCRPDPERETVFPAERDSVQRDFLERGIPSRETRTCCRRKRTGERERCGPVETMTLKDERPAREEREGEREKERCVGRENEKNYPSQHVLAF
jgi:hypothetical protein